MQSDDLLPNDGTFLGGVPREPIEQEVERKKERAQTLEGLSVLKDLVELYEDDIAFYGSVDAIPAAVKADPDKFLIVHNANELVRNALRVKKEYIEGLLEANAKNR